MDSLKRKRPSEVEIDLPRIKYHVSQADRAFERLLKENSHEELCDLIRRKLNLNTNTPLELHQIREGVAYDLEDDEDFCAFKAAAFAYKSLDIDVKYDISAPAAPPPTVKLDIPPQTTTSAIKRKASASQKRVSLPKESSDHEQTQDVSSALNQIADAHIQEETSEPPKKRQKKEPTSAKRRKSNAAETKLSVSNDDPPVDSKKAIIKKAQVVSKPKSTKAKTKETAKETDKKPEPTATEEAKKEPAATKGKKKMSTAPKETKDQASSTVRKASQKRPANDTSEDIEKSPTDSSEDVSSSEASSASEKAKFDDDKTKEYDSSEDEQAVVVPKRKQKDGAETQKQSVESEEPPKKKKKVVESDQASNNKRDMHATSVKKITVGESDRSSKKEKEVNGVSAVARKPDGATEVTSSIPGKTKRCTVVPLTASSAPSLSALTGSKRRSRKPSPAERSSSNCPLCHEQFHFRFKCPVIADGIASMEKRKAELQAEGGQEALISELDDWIQKRKTHARPNESSISTAQTTSSTSSQAFSQPPSVVPAKSKRSEVAVESQDEDSESDSSTSDGEDDTSKTNSPSESSPSNSPSMSLADVDLQALVRGPSQNSLDKALLPFEKEEKDNDDDDDDDSESDGEEGLLEEEEEAQTKNRSRISWLNRETGIAEEEEDDDSSSSVDNDKSKFTSVVPIISTLRSTEASSTSQSPKGLIELDGTSVTTSNNRNRLVRGLATAVAEQTLGGRQVTDQRTPVAEDTTIEIPGDNVDPSNPKVAALPPRNSESAVMKSPIVVRTDVVSKLSRPSVSENFQGSANGSPSINSANMRTPSHNPQQTTNPSPERQLSVPKSHGLSSANRRIKEDAGNHLLDESRHNIAGRFEKDGEIEKINHVAETSSPTPHRDNMPTSVQENLSLGPRVASTSAPEPRPRKRGRPPLSEAVKAERQAAKAAEKKAKTEAKKALAEAHKNARKAGVVTKSPERNSLASPKAAQSAPTQNALKEGPSPKVLKSPFQIIPKSQSSLSLANSPPTGSQWRVLPPPSETEPSQTFDQIDELGSSQTEKNLDQRPNILTSASSRTVTGAIDEANADEIVGTVDDHEDDDDRQPLFLPGASQPTQVLSEVFVSSLAQDNDTDDEAKEEKAADENKSENLSIQKKQYKGGSPSVASSSTESDDEEEPPSTQRPSVPKPIIKNPFPSLSQLSSNFLPGPPSFLMPSRFATSSSQSQNTLSKPSQTNRQLNQANSDSEDEDDADTSSDEEETKSSHIPKEKRAGVSIAKKKRKGLLQD